MLGFDDDNTLKKSWPQGSGFAPELATGLRVAPRPPGPLAEIYLYHISVRVGVAGGGHDFLSVLSS
ncbi:hypothetical protein ES703_35971 [subsurface metagenome]